MAAKVAKQENHIEGLSALLQDSKRDVHRAKDELRHERNRRIRAENDPNVVIESLMKKAIVDALKRARLKAKAEREREKSKR